jgi:hypothetical protein
MTFKFDDSGLKKFQKNLDKMAKNAQELDGENQVPLDQLFTHNFMWKYTSFNDFESFLNSGFPDVKTEKDFLDIPDAEMDKHVSAATRFTTWEEMMESAMGEWVASQLGF